MTPALLEQLTGITVVLLWLAVVVGTALAVRHRFPDQREWSRKVVHIGTGPVVLLAWGLGIARWVALPAAIAVTVATALNHRFRVLPAVEDVDRHSYGTVAYGASIAILLALFWPQQPLAVAAGVLVMAIGDGLAGLVGPQLRSPRWRVLGQGKSLAGTVAMGGGALVVLVLLQLIAQSQGMAAPGWPQVIAIALLATALEQGSSFGIDNLTVPLSAGLLWQHWAH
ncbi:MAG: dolichol kinase [Vulcanococcus sp.]|uniref:diacylglycerol/polyprenol kinase family protein n=1 Tax=Vulcanococcus sp. TaxID=2856995 RepID=UPI0025FF199A|nr:dolichol kinase [Vulcanococcus sp.]MBW0167356.1 dolichol kinase [Vulcanococcus sp.]